MIENYLSKLKFGFQYSHDFITLVKLIFNTKKYSRAFRNKKSNMMRIFHFYLNITLNLIIKNTPLA